LFEENVFINRIRSRLEIHFRNAKRVFVDSSADPQTAVKLEPSGWSETYIKMGECYKGLRNYEKTVEFVEIGRVSHSKKRRRVGKVC